MNPDRSAPPVRRLSDIPRKARLAVFGAGKQGRALCSALAAHRPDVTVPFLLDDFAAGAAEGIAVIAPNMLRARQRDVDFVVIPGGCAQQAMSDALLDIGYESFRLIHPDLDLAHMFFPEEWEAAGAAIENVRELLYPSDQALFMKLMAARAGAPERLEKTGKVLHKTFPTGGCQYLDYLNPAPVKIAVEGGVGSGNSTLAFLKHFPNLSRLYGFDPCSDLYEKSPYRSEIEQTQKCDIRNQGLWRRPGRLWVKDRRAWSSIAETPDSTGNCRPAEVTSIDALAESENIRVDFIKLDVEGGEMDALQGAEKTLTAHRPQLAVSIYHTKQDMTRIPLFLKPLLTDYMFRLGHYSPSFSETVLYAIPEKNAS